MLTHIVRTSLLLFFLLKLFCFSFAQTDSKKVIIKEFKIIGNKTTRENIIIREVPFQINDTISQDGLQEVLERTHSNLFNTSLFNFIVVEPVYFDETNISIYITVEERWYWWPIPIFDIQETNFNTWWLDKDYNKVNYGLFLAKENFRGRKETVMLLFQGGFTEKLGVKYIIPYINKKKTNGLSLKFSYSRNHEVSYSTTNNFQDYYRSESDYIQKEINSNIGYELRPRLYNKHNFNLEYTSVDVADSIVSFNSDYLSGKATFMEFFSFNYTFKRDKRNNKNYPTKGVYYDLKLNKDGLGLVNNELNSLYFTSHFKKFWQLSDKFYFSSSIKAKYTTNEGPYYLYKGLGSRNDLVRGYELYVINGEHFGVCKAQLRYGLLQDKMFNFKALKADKFNKIPLSIYLGAYFDAGYVDSKINNIVNPLTNSVLLGGGVSADFVTYYDMVLRLEYSVNKLNEKGLFLHFIAPI